MSDDSSKEVNRRYINLGRRKRLIELIEAHDEEKIKGLMKWSANTLRIYTRKGPRDVSERTLDVLEYRLQKLDKK